MNFEECREFLRQEGYFVQNLWCDLDVIKVAEEMGIKRELNKEDCIEVMDYIGQHFDAEYGVTWTTIENAIEELFKEELI